MEQEVADLQKGIAHYAQMNQSSRIDAAGTGAGASAGAGAGVGMELELGTSSKLSYSSR